MFSPKKLEEEGYCILPQVLSKADLKIILTSIESIDLSLQENKEKTIRQRKSKLYAIRHFLKVIPEIRPILLNLLLESSLKEFLSPHFFIINSILFDKVPESNWKVPWHQDVIIPVKEKKETLGFQSWSEKSGIPHVQPPVHVLENLLIVRLHLDHCFSDNGALQIIPGSHRYGRISASEMKKHLVNKASFTCEVPAGGALLMKPLLLHSSAPSTSPHHRRILHLEYASQDLPGDLEHHIA